MMEEKIVTQMIVDLTQHFVKDVPDELIEQFTNDFEENLTATGTKKTEPQNFFAVFHVEEFRDTDYDMELWTQIENATNISGTIFYSRRRKKK